MTGNLLEEEKINIDSEIISLDIAEVESEREIFRFLAVGSLDNTIRLYSLDKENCLNKISI